MLRKAFSIITGVIIAGSTAAAADWPNFRGPHHDGISPETGIQKDWTANPPRILWRMSMEDMGYAGPSVAGGVLYVVDHVGNEDIVRAVNSEDGSEIWTYSYPDHPKENYGYARATPAVDEGRVYVLSRLGLVHCLDATTGGKVWARNLIKEFGGKSPKWEMSMSPLIHGDRLILYPGGDTAAVALDKISGRTIWKGGGSDLPGYATPVAATIEGRAQYVFFTGVSLIGVHGEGGDLLWRLPWKTSYDVNAATPVVLGDEIFITSGYKHGCALVRVSDGTPVIRWQNRALVGHFNSPVYSGGYVYGIGDPGVLVCLDPMTGKVAWQKEGFEKGGVVGVDGMIIAISGKKGDVVLVEMTPEAYRERGRIRPLGGRSWTAPIVADGRLYVRNTKALVCLSLK